MIRDQIYPSGSTFGSREDINRWSLSLKQGAAHAMLTVRGPWPDCALRSGFSGRRAFRAPLGSFGLRAAADNPPPAAGLPPAEEGFPNL